LGEAVNQINPKFGRLVSKDEALEHAQRCREAGLVHMIGRNKLDSVWLGAGPSQKLLTICNCCPCCCLWGIIPQLSPLIRDKVSRMPGVNVMVTERCIGCGTCSEGVCFVDAIQVVDGFAVINETCRGCGRCVEICPNEAIELSVDYDEIPSAMIKRISSLVDIT
jgi:ferredoxin